MVLVVGRFPLVVGAIEWCGHRHRYRVLLGLGAVEGCGRQYWDRVLDGVDRNSWTRSGAT